MNETRYLIEVVRKAIAVLELARVSNSLSFSRRIAGEVADNLRLEVDAMARAEFSLHDNAGVRWADKPEEDDIKF